MTKRDQIAEVSQTVMSGARKAIAARQVRRRLL